jgi:hypothetical protein
VAFSNLETLISNLNLSNIQNPASRIRLFNKLHAFQVNNMNKPLITILLLSSLTLACRDYDYNIIAGQSYLAPHPPPSMAGGGRNVADDKRAGDSFQFRGTYAVEPHGKVAMLRQFDRERGGAYVTLDDLLPYPEGALVEVFGTVVTRVLPIRGTGRTIEVNELAVRDHRILCDNAPLLDLARKEYAKIREDLQEKIAAPGSKLRLAADPDWRVDWLEEEAAILVVAHSYDLMYAAEFQKARSTLKPSTSTIGSKANSLISTP